MQFFDEIKYNWKNKKGLVFIVLFRCSHFFAKNGKALKIIGLPVRIFYKIFIQWVLGIDIPDRTKIGYGFSMFHGQGLIIHGDCLIGDYVLVRQNTTIGEKNLNGKVPRIGNNVEIGAHAIIIGDISIGDNSIIGAGSLINKDVPKDSLAFGNPMVIKHLKK